MGNLQTLNGIFFEINSIKQGMHPFFMFSLVLALAKLVYSQMTSSFSTAGFFIEMQAGVPITITANWDGTPGYMAKVTNVYDEKIM